MITDNGELVQVNALKASKENAVEKICNGFDISLESVMVFGDDFNDIGLFKVCGWPVAMGNAIQQLKELAKEITETNDNDGVAMSLERFL